MKAGNLTISVPNKGCNKNCPYCVSKITGKTESNVDLMIRNTDKVKTLAKAAQVFCVLLTGKGEPTCNTEMMEFFIKRFAEFSVELQTNGIELFKNPGYLHRLSVMGLNIVAISIDDIEDFHPDLLKEIQKAGMLSRITFNVTNKLHMPGRSYQDMEFHDLIELCRGHVDQMTIRNVVVPNNTERCKETIWIEDNVDPSVYQKLEQQMIRACEEHGTLIMKLPYGAFVYDYEGLAVSYSRYCLQDHNNGEDIRSLIFQENGHVYTSWVSGASKFGV